MADRGFFVTVPRIYRNRKPPALLGPFRVLTCTVCGEKVAVHELPELYLDPALYVCGDCSGNRT